MINRIMKNHPKDISGWDIRSTLSKERHTQTSFRAAEYVSQAARGRHLTASWQLAVVVSSQIPNFEELPTVLSLHCWTRATQR